MFAINRLAFAVLLIFCLLTPVYPRTRKGDKFVKDGWEAETRKQWEVALDLYEKAVLEDPSDVGYILASRRVRFQAAMARVGAGQKLRAAGQLEPALAEFQKAYAIDPSATIAEQEVKRTREMIEREKNPAGRASTPEERGLSPAEVAQKEVDEKVSRLMPLPELAPLNRQPLNLKMNNQPVRVLFETVGKLAGVNVVFDAEYQPPSGKSTFTVDLSNTTLEEALEHLSVQTKSFWKPLSANTIFVTNENPTKRRDYEDFVVKVFYIKHATTVQELQELSVTIRSVTEIRRAFTYNAMNAILLRGTADQIALAEKLIADLDKPKAEVVVDVIVMEANRAKVRNIGASLTTGGAPGINLPIFYGSTAPSDDSDDEQTAPGTIPLNRIKSLGLGDFSTIVPGAVLRLLMSDNQTRILQQPQVRAVEGYKATLKIGDRVPYATGSFQPGVGGVGLNPLVSTQFNYIDTGVNVDIQPKVHGRDEVSLHVEIDLNNVSREVLLGDLRQPVITQKKIVHDIRLKEGEVNLLGGLLGVQDTRAVQGIPGLASIPIIGRLFGPESVERNRGELLIALIPHIVRAPDYTESNLRGVSAGPDAYLKLNYAPRTTPRSAQGTPAPPPTAPQTQPAPVTPNPNPPAPGQPPVPPPAQTAPAQPPANQPVAVAPPASDAPRLVFSSNTLETQISSAVTVELRLENVNDLTAAPLRVKYDPKMLRLTGVRPGNLLTGDGSPHTFSENTSHERGEATVTLNRNAGTASISGSGPLLQLTFQAIGKGNSSVTVIDPGLKNSQMQPITVATPTLNVVVQ